MKSEELKKKKDEDLKKELGEKRTALREARFDAAGSKLRNANEMRTIKKDIARILTEINSRK